MQALSVFQLAITAVRALYRRGHCDIAVERSTVMASKHCIFDIPPAYEASTRETRSSPQRPPPPAILLLERKGPGATLVGNSNDVTFNHRVCLRCLPWCMHGSDIYGDHSNIQFSILLKIG